MTTDKRARQKANRATRVAAAEAADAKARMRSRLMTYGIGALAIVVAIIGIAVLTSDDDDNAADNDDAATATDPTDAADPTDTLDPLTTAPVFDPTTVDWVYPEFDTEISDDCPPADGSAERTIDFEAAPPTCIDVTKSYTAVFDTSEGEVTVELDTTTTPGTVNSFVYLARYGYYDGTTIFRTDPSIDIIQGGSPHTESPSDPGPGYTIVDEPTLNMTTGQLRGPYSYEAGQLVMARSQGPDASGAQFFFVTGENAAALDGQGVYIVFGTTDDAGIDVLQSIIGLHEDDPSSGLGGAPSREVTVNSVTIVEA
ncbi:MAG: peptidylprolyl isomerase [Acidimicrobiales bacterium]